MKGSESSVLLFSVIEKKVKLTNSMFFSHPGVFGEILQEAGSDSGSSGGELDSSIVHH